MPTKSDNQKSNHTTLEQHNQKMAAMVSDVEATKLLSAKQAKSDKRVLDMQPSIERANLMAGNVLSLTAFRSERNLILYPFCTVSDKKVIEPIKYRSPDGSRWLDIIPSQEHGMVNIWDFDVLRWALSKAGEIAWMAECDFPDFVDFTCYELLKGLGKNTHSGSNQEWFKTSMLRLASTFYNGNILSSKGKGDAFTLMTFEYVPDRCNNMTKIRMHFSHAIKNSIRFNNTMLEVPASYHQKSGIKKRLLELVKVRMGKSKIWDISLLELQAICPHTGSLTSFKTQVKKYTSNNSTNPLPWISNFSFMTCGRGEKITFERRG